MIEHGHGISRRPSATALLLALALGGCANAYSSPCESPIAATYTAYCNPYRQTPGPN